MEPTPTQLRYIKRNARRAARDILAAYAEHSRIPVKPIAIARSMGLRVFEAPLPGDAWGMILGNLGGTTLTQSVTWLSTPSTSSQTRCAVTSTTCSLH